MTTYTVVAQDSDEGTWMFQSLAHPGALSEGHDLADAYTQMPEAIAHVADIDQDTITIAVVLGTLSEAAAAPTLHMSEAELGAYYDRTHDLSEFDDAHPQPWDGSHLNISFQVSFTRHEANVLHERAAAVDLDEIQYLKQLGLGGLND